MKNQALFSTKDESNRLIKCRLLQFLFGTLIRVKKTYRQYGVSNDRLPILRNKE